MSLVDEFLKIKMKEMQYTHYGRKSFEQLDEGFNWKAALLTAIMTVSGLSGAFAKSPKAQQLTPDEKIEVCINTIKERSGGNLNQDDRNEIYAEYAKVMFGTDYNELDPASKMAIMHSVNPLLALSGASGSCTQNGGQWATRW